MYAASKIGNVTEFSLFYSHSFLEWGLLPTAVSTWARVHAALENEAAITIVLGLCRGGSLGEMVMKMPLVC